MSRGIGALRRVSNWRPTGPPLPRPLSTRCAGERGEFDLVLAGCGLAGWGPLPRPLSARSSGRGENSIAIQILRRARHPPPRCLRERAGEGGPADAARSQSKSPASLPCSPRRRTLRISSGEFIRSARWASHASPEGAPRRRSAPSVEPPRSAQKALPPIRMIGGRAPGMRKGAGALYSTTAAEGSTPAASVSTTTAVSAVAAAAAAAAATRARSFSTSSTTRRGSMGLAR